MIKIITGQKGEGKTKTMIDAANQTVGKIKGHAVYIDSTHTHRFALSYQVRLIEASNFPLKTQRDFFGFLCGILSSNHDIEIIFIDELVKLTHCSSEELTLLFEQLLQLSDDYNLLFVISTSFSTHYIPDHLSPVLIPYNSSCYL